VQEQAVSLQCRNKSKNKSRHQNSVQEQEQAVSLQCRNKSKNKSRNKNSVQEQAVPLQSQDLESGAETSQDRVQISHQKEPVHSEQKESAARKSQHPGAKPGQSTQLTDVAATTSSPAQHAKRINRVIALGSNNTVTDVDPDDDDELLRRDRFGEFETGQTVFSCRAIWIEGVQVVEFGSVGLVRAFKRSEEGGGACVDVKFKSADSKPLRISMTLCDISSAKPVMPAPFENLQVVYASERMRFDGAIVHFGAPCMVIGVIENGDRIVCVSSKRWIPEEGDSFTLRNPQYINVLPSQICAQKMQIPHPHSYEQRVFAAVHIKLGDQPLNCHIECATDNIRFGARGTVIGVDFESSQVVINFETAMGSITIPVAEHEIHTDMPLMPTIDLTGTGSVGSMVFATRDFGDPNSGSKFVPFGSPGVVTGGIGSTQLWVLFAVKQEDSADICSISVSVWSDEISGELPDFPTIEDEEVGYMDRVFALQKLAANDKQNVPYGTKGRIAGYTETRKKCRCCSDYYFVVRFDLKSGTIYVMAEEEVLSLVQPVMPTGFGVDKQVYAMHTHLHEMGFSVDLSNPDTVQFGCQGKVVGIKSNDESETSFIVRFMPEGEPCIASVRPDQISTTKPIMVDGFKVNQKVWTGRACEWSIGDTCGTIPFGDQARVLGVRADPGKKVRIVVGFYNEHGKRFNVGDSVFTGSPVGPVHGTIVKLDYWEPDFGVVDVCPYQVIHYRMCTA
jgi:hypothetical protein